jgi:hypothetical protein
VKIVYFVWFFSLLTTSLAMGEEKTIDSSLVNNSLMAGFGCNFYSLDKITPLSPYFDLTFISSNIWQDGDCGIGFYQSKYFGAKTAPLGSLIITDPEARQVALNKFISNSDTLVLVGRQRYHQRLEVMTAVSDLWLGVNQKVWPWLSLMVDIAIRQTRVEENRVGEISNDTLGIFQSSDLLLQKSFTDETPTMVINKFSYWSGVAGGGLKFNVSDKLWTLFLKIMIGYEYAWLDPTADSRLSWRLEAEAKTNKIGFKAGLRIRGYDKVGLPMAMIYLAKDFNVDELLKFIFK